MKNVHSGIRFFRAALLSIICMFVFLCLTGCPTEGSSADKSIGEITIYNIPAQITVNGSDAAPNDTFKIYLNASNYQVDNKPPAAKGVAFISSGVKDPVSGTYSVQIELQKPLPADEHDPNFQTDPWSGTSNYFSVMISPVDPKSVGV
ncbi:MAG: hypothetical protein FWF29_12720, partial [Treponema sp.]|nr:hypothetical protein [Treponema sp.]